MATEKVKRAKERTKAITEISSNCSSVDEFIDKVNAAGIGITNSTEYKIWHNMHQRCGSRNHVKFHRYGGRGIKVCDEWNSFLSFLKDVGLRPSLKHELDRENNNLGYSKSNCRWVRHVSNVFNSQYKRKSDGSPRGVRLRKSGNYEVRLTIGGIGMGFGTHKDLDHAMSIYNEICLEWYGKLPPSEEAELILNGIGL